MSQEMDIERAQEWVQAFYETEDFVYLQNAINCFDALYHEGNLRAGRLLASCYQVGDSFGILENGAEEGLRILLNLDNKGYQSAKYFLGLCYSYLGETERAFDSFYAYNLENPDDLEGIFELAKCYKDGKGTSVNLEKSRKLFEQLASVDEYKRNDLFADQYSDLFLKLGDYEKADLWRWTAFYDTNDDISKAGYAYDLIENCLERNPQDLWSATAIFNEGMERFQLLSKIFEDNKGSIDNDSIIWQSWANAKNLLSIYRAEHLEILGENIEEVSDDPNSEYIDAARHNVLNGNKSAADSIYRKVLEIEPANWEAAFFTSIIAEMQVSMDNYQMVLRNLRKQTLSVAQEVKNYASYESEEMLCVMVSSVVIECAGNIYDVLHDTYEYLIITKSTYNRLSPVGFSNKIYVPTMKEIANTLYTLGDSFEKNGTKAKEACDNLWKMGNMYMKMCADLLGFFEKMEAKSTIRTYEGKINRR